MIASALALVLAASPHLAVVVVEDAGQPRVAEGAASALGAALEAPPIRLGAYLKAAGPECRHTPRCLSAAPELDEVPRFLALGLRGLPGGRLAAELQLIDRGQGQPVGRSAAAVEKAELGPWAVAAAARLLKAGAAGTAPRSLFPAANGWATQPMAAWPAQPAAQHDAPRLTPARAPAPALGTAPVPARPGAPPARRNAPESEWTTPEAMPKEAKPGEPRQPAPRPRPAPSSRPVSGDDK